MIDLRDIDLKNKDVERLFQQNNIKVQLRQNTHQMAKTKAVTFMMRLVVIMIGFLMTIAGGLTTATGGLIWCRAIRAGVWVIQQ